MAKMWTNKQENVVFLLHILSLGMDLQWICRMNNVF